MLPKNPKWVDQNSISSVQPFTSSTQLTYDPLGPIPFPKADVFSGLEKGEPLSGLDKLLQSILMGPLNKQEVKSVFKLSKELKEKISDLKLHSKFNPTIFSNVYTTKNYELPSHQESVFKINLPHPKIEATLNVFQSLEKCMDDAYYPPHCMTIQGTTLLPKSYLPSLDLTPCDVKEFCSQVKIDPTLIDLVAIDYSEDYPDHCKITIEKRIPF
jgi:hypothetical protein